jgi:ribonuclease HII
LEKPLESRKRKHTGENNDVKRRKSLERYDRLEMFDRKHLAGGARHLAGLDEAGRGALAGPVVAAAVILPPDTGLVDVDDSKRLSEKQRENVFSTIVEKALAVGIGVGHPTLIDDKNILVATLIAMARAAGNLRIEPSVILVDGRDVFESSAQIVPVVGGDRQSLAVAAASIVAKVARDRMMRRLHERHPVYNFMSNKGYGTREHLDAIGRHGVTAVHRKSYRLKTVEKTPRLF